MKTIQYFFAPLLWLLSTWSLAIAPHELTISLSPVVDTNGYLSSTENRLIEQRLRHWNTMGLMQGAVIIIDSTDNIEPFDYAMHIAERWKLGNAKTDNGLIFLIAMNDRQYFILTGKGLEGVLPDILVKKIAREQFTPALKQNQLAQGINDTLTALIKQLQADPEIQANAITTAQNETLPDNLFEQIAPIAIPLFIFTIVLRQIIGQILGSAIGAIAMLIGGLFIGLSIPAAIVASIFFFVLVQFFALSSNRHYYAGNIIIGGRRDDNSTQSRWNNDRDYRGGGGGFSGGGAGGSW